LEISNPGQLPIELTVETIKKIHTSYPKNPLIAECLYLAHYIERMGTGIQDIMKKCKDYGLPEPEFRVQGGFSVKIYRKKDIAFRKISTENVTENVTEKRYSKILKLLAKDGKISFDELAERLSVARMTVYRDLEKLKARGLIERVGPDKGGYWRVLRK
jgi:ATP-dependent DNA helicase RecG